jgi:hypothetical protein
LILWQWKDLLDSRGRRAGERDLAPVAAASTSLHAK